jgi:hypothetical protein
LRKIIISLSFMGLMGCTSAQQVQYNNVIQQAAAQLPQVCLIAAAAYTSFQAVVAADPKKVSATVIRDTNAVMAALTAICPPNPAPTDPVNALAAATRAYGGIIAAMNAAKKG